jgi:hypothetical protein
MNSEDYEVSWQQGYRAARQELSPLADAISEAIVLLNNLNDSHNMTPTQRRRVMDMCVPMSRQLDRLLKLSKLPNGGVPLDIRP